MKKVIMLMVVLFTTVGIAYAQFEKGKWYANASLTGLGLSHSKYEGTKFGFSMNGGAFVADNVAILLNFQRKLCRTRRWMLQPLVLKAVIILQAAVYTADWECLINICLVPVKRKYLLSDSRTRLCNSFSGKI